MNAAILAHSLVYASKGGVDQDDAIFEPLEVTRFPDDQTFSAVDGHVFNLIKGGTLVITSSSSSKSIFAGVLYFIAKPVDTGFAVKQLYVTSIEEVRALLKDGWKICKKTAKLGYIDVLTPSDSEYLISRIDMRMSWRETICAVINCELENYTNWSTKGVHHRALCKLLKEEDVNITEEVAGFEKGAVVSSDVFVTANVLRGLEKHLNVIFELVKANPDALFNAEPSVQGFDLMRYADTRALMWHLNEESERIKREQAIEDGLSNSFS